MSHKSKTVIFFVTKTGIMSEEARAVIRNNHGRNPKIKPMMSGRIFCNDVGFSLFVRQYHGLGVIYAYRSEISDEAFKEAEKSGLPFHIFTTTGNGLAASRICGKVDEAKFKTEGPRTVSAIIADREIDPASKATASQN